MFLNHKLSSKLRRKLCEMSVRQATLSIKNNGKLQNIHMDLSITCLLGFEKKKCYILSHYVCMYKINIDIHIAYILGFEKECYDFLRERLR